MDGQGISLDIFLNNGNFYLSFNTLKYKLSIRPKETGSYFTSRCLASYIHIFINEYETMKSTFTNNSCYNRDIFFPAWHIYTKSPSNENRMHKMSISF